MKAKKAAAYPASSVCFYYFFIINIFILDSFRIAVVTSNLLITFTPPSPSLTAKIKKLLHLYN